MRYIYTARLVPLNRAVYIPIEKDDGLSNWHTFDDKAFEIERTAKTKPEVWVGHDPNLRIGRVVQLYTEASWWCAHFGTDERCPDDIEFDVGQPVSVGLSQLKIGSRGTFLREVSVVSRAAVKGAEIIGRFAVAKPSSSLAARALRDGVLVR